MSIGRHYIVIICNDNNNDNIYSSIIYNNINLYNNQ